MNSRIALPTGFVLSVLLAASPCGAQQSRSADGVLAAARARINSDTVLKAYVETQDSATLRRDYLRCDAQSNCEIAGHKRVLVIRLMRLIADTAIVGITTHVTARSPAARRPDGTPLASRTFVDVGFRRWTFVYSNGTWTRTSVGGITS